MASIFARFICSRGEGGCSETHASENRFVVPTKYTLYQSCSPSLREKAKHITELPLVFEHGLVLRVMLKGDAHILRVPAHVNNLPRTKKKQ